MDLKYNKRILNTNYQIQNEKIEKNEFKENNYNKNYTEKWNEDSYEDDDTVKIDEKIINEIEKTVGYDKNYVINCLKKNIINYATATYYLLSRESNVIESKKYGDNIDFYS